jgi:hypothetical protein
MADTTFGALSVVIEWGFSFDNSVTQSPLFYMKNQKKI